MPVGKHPEKENNRVDYGEADEASLCWGMAQHPPSISLLRSPLSGEKQMIQREVTFSPQTPVDLHKCMQCFEYCIFRVYVAPNYKSQEKKKHDKEEKLYKYRTGV